MRIDINNLRRQVNSGQTYAPPKVPADRNNVTQSEESGLGNHSPMAPVNRSLFKKFGGAVCGLLLFGGISTLITSIINIGIGALIIMITSIIGLIKGWKGFSWLPQKVELIAAILFMLFLLFAALSSI